MTTEQQSQVPATPAAPVVEAKPANQVPATTPAVAQKTETPAEYMIPQSRFNEVNNELLKLKDEAAKKALDDQKAEDARLVKEAQWQTLADQRKAKVEELTPKVELADKLSAMALAQYAAEIKEWPEQVKAMAPADDADILTKLAWMNKAKPLAAELMGDKPVTPGNGRRPTPVSPAGTAKAVEEQRSDHKRRATRRYK